MPMREGNMYVLRGFFFLFIKTVQIQNYSWVSTKTRVHVEVFSSFSYGLIVNIMSVQG